MRRELVSSIGTILAASLAGGCCLGPTLFVLFGIASGSLGYLTTAHG